MQNRGGIGNRQEPISKPILLGITTAIIIGVIAPLVIPHISHPSMIYHIILHLAGMIISAFLGLVSCLAYKRVRGTRIDFVDSTGRKIPLSEYFDIYKDDSSKSKTFSPDESFYKIVKERGWSIKEDCRWRDRYWTDYMKKYGYDALPEDLFLHEEAIPESERLKYSKHRRWGLLADIVAAKRAA
jgi:hypothetical protein